jgi:hypothetical protein
MGNQKSSLVYKASNSVNNNIIRSTAFNYPSTSDNGLLPRLFKSNPNTVNTLGTIFYSNNNSVSQFPKPKIPNRPLNNAENTVHKFTPIALPSKIAAPSQENNVTQLTRQPLANNQNNGTVGEMQKSYGSGKRQRRQGYFVHSAVAPQSIAVSSNSISANNQSDRAGWLTIQQKQLLHTRSIIIQMHLLLTRLAFSNLLLSPTKMIYKNQEFHIDQMLIL